MVNVLVHVLKGMKEKRAINITIILECRHQKIISSRPATQKKDNLCCNRVLISAFIKKL